MMPAATHFDPVIGVDIHMIQPPGPVPPVPIPHPYVGMHLDPFDYAPFIGSTILVNGVHRAIAGTAGKAIPPHIPIGGVFVPVLPANEHEAFMGAATVEFDGDAANFMALPCLSCQSIGMPPPPRLNPKKGTKITVPVLPLSVVLPVPKGPPVLIGGPPTISLMSLVTNMIGPLAQLFGMTKAGKKVFGAASKAADKAKDVASKAWRKAFAWMPPGFVKCKVLKAEPVDIRTGEVVVDQLDFELPGRIPLRWKRGYRSSGTRPGVCGRGWDTPADARIERNADGSVLFLDGEGAGALFDTGPQRGPVREPVDGWLLDRTTTHWTVRKKGGLTWHFPIPNARESLVDAVVDACGNWVQYQRGPEGLARVVESAGRSLEVVSRGGLVERIVLHHPDFEERRVMARFEYDADRRLVAQYDALDHPYRFAWNADGRLARHTNRVGLSFYYDYDADGRCVHAWGDGGLYDYHFRYDPDGRWTNWTDSLGHKWGVELDERGNVVAETDPLGAVTSYAYDEAGRTVEVVDPRGNASRFDYDERGCLVGVTRPDGSSVATTFDALGRPLTRTDPAGNLWRSRRDARGFLTERTSPLGVTTRVTVSDLGDPLRVEEQGGALTRFAYDRFGLCTAETDGAGRERRYAYDMLGRMISRSRRDGSATAYLRDRAGRAVSVRYPDQTSFDFELDPEGRPVATVDRSGARSVFTYTGLGEPLSCVRANGTQVEYRYDNEERLTAILRGGEAPHRFERDPRGRVVLEDHPDAGVTRTSFRSDGATVVVEDATGRRTAFAYDAMDRLVATSAADGSAEEFAYDPLGRLVAARSPAAIVERRYDADGNLLAETTDGYVVEQDLDAAGRLTRQRRGGDFAVEFRRDPLGKLRQVAVADRWAIDMEASTDGAWTREKVSSGLTRLARYDAEGRRIGQRVQRGDEVLVERTYSYAADGRMLAREDRSGEGRLRLDVQYDPCGHVSTWRVSGDASAHPPDGRGRREAPAHRRDAAGFAVFADAGQGGVELAWDARGRLGSARRVADGLCAEYRYDALGRRLSKTVGSETTHFRWFGDHLIGQQGPSFAAQFIHRDDSLEPLAVVTDDLLLVDADPNGVPRALCGAGQGIVAEQWTDGLSRVRSASGMTGLMPQRLLGHYHDAETGLHYARYRYLDPESLTFLSADPLGAKGGDDLFGYPPDPWSWIDPLGLECRQLYRGMTEVNGKPKTGPSARTLGARPGDDIPVDANGFVKPNTGGMSVAPDTPSNLPRHRRPPEFDGTGKDPVWVIDEDDLGPDLKYVQDKPDHGTIQPTREMTEAEYQAALAATQDKWKKVPPPPP